MSKKLWMKFLPFLFPKWQQSWTLTKLHTFLPIRSSFILNFLILFLTKFYHFNFHLIQTFNTSISCLALIVQKNPNLPEILYNLTCLRVWLWLLFKILFMLKYIKIIFFYFLKIIYKIIASKRSKTYKKINF